MGDLLKQYAIHHNLLSLYGNKSVVGFRPTHKLTIHDKAKLYDLLKQEGVFDDLASINHATLTTFIKNNPSILNSIDKSVASRETTLTFGKIKMNEEERE